MVGRGRLTFQPWSPDWSNLAMSMMMPTPGCGRAIEQTLWAAGVDDNLRAAHAPGEAASRKAAALMAQKKRLGPWRTPSDCGGDAAGDLVGARKAHEKAVAAMLRAGHQRDHVRFILAASREEDVTQWLDEAADEEEADRW